MMSERTFKVMLRQERSGENWRSLWAYVDADGAVHIDGQDLGPATVGMADDGEYEWFQKIAPIHVPRLLTLLGGQSGDDILDVLAGYRGEQSYVLEKLLRQSDIPVEFHSC
jgi:hypothetical protein